MDPNKLAENINNKGGFRAVWQWLNQSPTRLTGIILLGLSFVLFLALMVIISQKNISKKTVSNTPYPSPAAQLKQNILSPLPSPKPDVTLNWTVLTNIYGFQIKYPSGSKLTPVLPQAYSSATLQITSAASTLALDIVDKNNPIIKGKSLKEIVDLIREKNATSSANITVKKVLTKPILILYGGNEGYEWYLESSGLIGLDATYTSKLGKNRIIEFDKNNKHYLIFTSFDDLGEQLLSTLNIIQ
ncbi:hypothetical protein HYS96_01275 [Candidatus Daviesbacteria bacterium]|nr:hypothetical protein [Candidatus Daviesbacteria bacterium]